MAGNDPIIKVKIDNVVKKFTGHGPDTVALNGVDLDILDNEFVSVIGPSGCGKSTLLNIIAGLIAPTSGHVYVDGKEVSDPGPERGVVFQQYALFPWLTVEKNVQFGLLEQGINKREAAAQAMKYLEMVDLAGFATAYPKELSGGMKQRVAIARAYAVNGICAYSAELRMLGYISENGKPEKDQSFSGFRNDIGDRTTWDFQASNI